MTRPQVEDFEVATGAGDEEQRIPAGAYGANFARLGQIKAQYDPGNLFRMNQNIRPAG